MLNLAVAGGGVIGRRHIELIEQNPRTRLVALVDPAPAAVAMAAGLGVPHFESLAAMFEQGAGPAHGVVLATPNGQHVTGALECLRHATPALIEKPLDRCARVAASAARDTSLGGRGPCTDDRVQGGADARGATSVPVRSDWCRSH